MRRFLTGLLGVFAAVAAEAAEISVTQANIGDYRTLQDGNTYVFAEDVDFTAEKCTSALKVADGATVEIRVSRDVKVKLTGGEGNGPKGAGAGIEVPKDAKLIISGEGELTATGGAGGTGADGVHGGWGVTGRNDSYSTTSSGGNGGAGGGGAGAGIGGCGGAGGQGGIGGLAFTAPWDSPVSGRNGNEGKPGTPGGDYGTIEIRETVTVIAVGGATGAKGAGGSMGDWSRQDGATWNWAAYGSGGGGGGGGGCSAADVGGGGGGAGGGGGGGGGGLSYTGTADNEGCCRKKKNGLGGGGGRGDRKSSTGDAGGDRRGVMASMGAGGGGGAYPAETWDDDKGGRGGLGASGGEAGARGANGTVTIAPTARLVAGGGYGTYDVCRISDTERIRWESGKLYRIRDGADPEEITYTTVDNKLWSLTPGKWYVVKEDVCVGNLTFQDGDGVVNLVLLDNAEMTTDGFYGAGIKVDDNRTLNIFGVQTGSLIANGGEDAAGIDGCVSIYGGVVTATGGNNGAGIGGGTYATVTIYGGIVTATGGTNGAGIGGGYGCFGGTVTINGGVVTARGGANGAGIGSGAANHASKPSGGTVTINGGTVMAACNGYGEDIGRGENGYRGATVTINGGNVVAGSILDKPTNDKKDALYRVTVKCPGLMNEEGGLRIAELDGYGTRDIHPVDDGKIVLWLPKGDYRFAVADSRKSYRYHAVVTGSDVAVEPLGDHLGLLVNGEDVGSGSGDGWTCAGSVLNLNAAQTYVISGEATDEAPIQVSVNANGATVVLSNAVVCTKGCPALVVKDNVGATLLMSGGASYLASTDNASAVSVGSGAALTVNLASTGSLAESMVGVYNYGNEPTISGAGAITVAGGTFAVWGDQRAVALSAFGVGADEVMAAGASFESANYMNDCGGNPCVLVGPAVTVTVPNAVRNVKDIVVSNNVQRLQPTVPGGTAYRVLRGNDVFVGFAAADEMHLVVGENPVRRSSVTGNTEIKADDFGVSAVQVLDDGHYYIASTSGGKQWIDTGYHPDRTTRIEADFHSLTRSQEWGTFFGLTGNDSSSDGVLLRYYANTDSVNGWFCNATYGEAQIGSLANTRILAELRAGEMNLNGEEKAITTTGNVCDRGSIYLFCVNNFEGGNTPKAWRHQAMRLHTFKIWDSRDGKEKLVHDFVPFRTEDQSVWGLFDRVTRRTYFNQGEGAFELGYDPGIRYRIWDATAREMRYRVCPDPIAVTSATDAFEDGKWYVVTNEVSRKTITVNGNAHLILCDGAKLTVQGDNERAGFAVAAGKSLTVYDQTLGTGELEARGGENGAGIGGGKDAAGGAITIYGGRVTATGGWSGAGIGGGIHSPGGATTIHGGTVTATGNGGAAGIGGGKGYAGSDGTVTINGGTVKASGDSQDILPAGYTAVEYIESTGGQYIDTGVAAKTGVKVEARALWTTENQDSAFIGAHKGDGDTRFYPIWYFKGALSYGHRKWISLPEAKVPANSVVDIVSDFSTAGQATIKVGNSEYKITDLGDAFDTGLTMYLGALNFGGSAGSHMQGRIYSCKIYEMQSGTLVLVRNFVPCVSASGEAGLYDTAKGKFYGNCGKNGDFKTGLPAGYERVEYIESTPGGKQYINTGYVPKKTTIVDCVVNVADNQPNYPSVVFGTQTAEGGRSKNNDNMSFFAWFRRQSTAYNRGTEEKQGKGFGYDKQVHLVCNGLNASWSSIDGLDSGEIDNAGPFNDCEDQNFPFYIFALDEPTGNPPYAPKDSTYLAMKLYSFKIYEGEELKRDFVPCVSASGEAGLYDTVQGKFYGNAGGGHFIAGGGAGGLNGTVTINGGNVRAATGRNTPKGAMGLPLYRVTVECSGLGKEIEERGGLRIEGLGDYGLNDVRAVNGELYLWLPAGKYSFKVGDGKTTHSYFAVVSGREQAVTVKPLTEAKVWVNGHDIFADKSGTGWSYDFMSRVLTLTGGTAYLITGVSTGDLVRIEVTANVNVTFSNAMFQVSSDAAITVNDGCTLHLSAEDGEDAVYLLGEGTMNAIRGGTTVVDRGFVCLWSEGAVPVSGAFSVSDGEIACVGKDADNLMYVESYVKSDSDRILLAGPRCRLEVPSVDHATVTVRCQEQALTPKSGGYDLMLGDTVTVRVKPDDGYVLRGAPAELTLPIVGDMSLPLELLPVALRGLWAEYLAATVDPETAAVSNWTATVDALLFDEVTNRLETVGKGEYGEEWYVVTGKLDCASICVTTGTVNLILYPGAILSLQGEVGEPGVGVMSNAFFNVYGHPSGGGTLAAFGGPYAAGIGGGGGEVIEDASDADAGTITVNGGTVIAAGGDFGAGIGGGAFGAGALLTVNGGSVFAYCGYDAEDIGGGAYGTDGVTVANGGTVMANSVETKPVNVRGEPAYRVYAVSGDFIPTNDVPLTVKGLGGYGTADVFADEDGVICFYLPNGHYEFTVNGWKCVAEVWYGTASATVSEERVPERGEGEGEGEGEHGGEGEGEGEGDVEVGDVWDGVDTAEVLGIEIGVPVKITVRTRVNWNYRLKRVTFEGGKMVVGDAIDFKTARSTSLTLEDDEPPAGAGFYVVEQSLK